MVRKILKKAFSILGLEVKRISRKPVSRIPTFSAEAALGRCLDRGVEINTVIDVGSSDGRWSRTCRNYYPNAEYLLIDAQDAHRVGLEKFKQECTKVDYLIAAAGNREGSIYFDNSELFGGIASEMPFEKNCIEVPIVTIDKLIQDRKLKGPYLIKLDTHGFEIPIIEGAMKSLKSAGLVIIETYNFKLTDDSFKYWEMSQYMDKLGFSSIEMVDLMLREKDSSFWQMDTFYIPSNRKEFVTNTYK